MKRKIDELKNVLVWFRSDLRTHDHRALVEAIKLASAMDVKLSALYVFAIDELKRQNIGFVRVDFVRRTLERLSESLSDLGIPLRISVLEAPGIEAYGNMLVEHCHEHSIGSIFFHKECDPIAISRDEAIKGKLVSEGIGFEDYYDQCIVREGVILTKASTPYGVFTPFKNTWLQFLKGSPLKLYPTPNKFVQEPELPEPVPKEIPAFSPPEYLDYSAVLEQFEAGEDVAKTKLERFLKEVGKSYKDKRNFPAINGTSKISPYLAIGSISPRLAFELSRKQNNDHLSSGSEGLLTFISELCWRDFYRHIAYHFPQIYQGLPFKCEAEKIDWSEGPEADAQFQSWCHGKTGIPIVDAAMRQLNATGWMHNRLRMIVSMFLTKDLLISWKKGEEWFAKNLIDYDFPSNNGGWQWSSSTGTDSQPYFRIFNPFTQSENFDSDGLFIKQFIPELERVPISSLHNPNSKLSKSDKTRLCPDYSESIVDHNSARLRALEVFKRAFSKSKS